MLSSDGKNKSFDAAADGYVRGEGAGALVILPLGKQRRRFVTSCIIEDNCRLTHNFNRICGTNGCGRSM